MGSKRLQGKSLMSVAGVPLLCRVINTTKTLEFINDLVVATSSLQQDDPIEAYLNYLNIDCVRGNSSDVLSRFILASNDLKENDHIVRITADNPFNWNIICLKLFKIHVSNNNDYTCVEGLSHVVCEFVKVSSLRTICDEYDLTEYDKEHVTAYFRDNIDKYKVEQVAPHFMGIKKKLDNLLTIDIEKDRELIENMIEDLDLDNRKVDQKDIYNWLLIQIDHQNIKN